jgi:regulator of protease activity HflC (stomatin/prohibitin superfamily)
LSLQENKKMLPPLIWMLCIAAGLALLAASIRRIPEGQVYALRRVGGHVRRVGPGTHFVLPLVERIARKINLAGASLVVDGLARDGHELRATLHYQVVDAARAERVLDDLGGMLGDATRSAVDQVDFPADTATRARWLKQALNARLRESGVFVARVDLG